MVNAMTWFTLVFIFFIGLCVGSFINVVIYRTLRGESFKKGRSYCDHCKKQLAWFDNIPLLSFLAYRGKSRCCAKKIDWTYPMVEFTTGIMFLWWATLGFAFFSLGQFPLIFLQPIFWLLVGIILVIIFFTDVLYMIIPDFATAALAVLTLAYRLYLVYSGAMQPRDLFLTFLASAVAFAFFLALFLGTKGRGMGFGDVKFAPVMALLLGHPRSLVGFFLSFLVGGIYASILLLGGKKKFGQVVPFGPFLVIGLVLALLWGEEIWQWYMGQLGV